jgi:shikimate kinase
MTDPLRLPPVRVVLLGMMGSGKSSVGRALSLRTGWPFVDNDALVEQATGRTARELLAASGEAAMRVAESAALATGLSLPGPVIVATAAGTILDADHRRRIAEAGFVVWLRAPASVLAARAVGARHRPWLDEDPEGWFDHTVAERDPLYAEIADLVVDTSLAAPDAAAEAIMAALARDRALPSQHADRA